MCNAMDVRLDTSGGQRREFLPVELEFFLYEPRDPEPPRIEIDLWHRTIGEYGKLLGDELPFGESVA